MLTSVTSPILLLLLPQLVFENIFLLPNEFTEKLSHPLLPLTLILPSNRIPFLWALYLSRTTQELLYYSSKVFCSKQIISGINWTSQSSSIYLYWVALLCNILLIQPTKPILLRQFASIAHYWKITYWVYFTAKYFYPSFQENETIA